MLSEEERKIRKREKQAKTNGINFKIKFGNKGYTKEQKQDMKSSLVERYKKARVKGFQNFLIVNSGVTATLEGVRRAIVKGLGKRNRDMIEDIVILKGYHAFVDEESDSDNEATRKNSKKNLQKVAQNPESLDEQSDSHNNLPEAQQVSITETQQNKGSRQTDRDLLDHERVEKEFQDSTKHYQQQQYENSRFAQESLKYVQQKVQQSPSQTVIIESNSPLYNAQNNSETLTTHNYQVLNNSSLSLEKNKVQPDQLNPNFNARTSLNYQVPDQNVYYSRESSNQIPTTFQSSLLQTNQIYSQQPLNYQDYSQFKQFSAYPYSLEPQQFNDLNNIYQQNYLPSQFDYSQKFQISQNLNYPTHQQFPRQPYDSIYPNQNINDPNNQMLQQLFQNAYPKQSQPQQLTHQQLEQLKIRFYNQPNFSLPNQSQF